MRCYNSIEEWANAKYFVMPECSCRASMISVTYKPDCRLETSMKWQVLEFWNWLKIISEINALTEHTEITETDKSLVGQI